MSIRIVVSTDGSGDFKTVQSAIDSIKDTCEAAQIFVKNGWYFEKVILNRPNVTIIGEDKYKTVITYNDSAKRLDENGCEYKTFKSATFEAGSQAENFKLKNITIENSAGYGAIVGQAVALYINCDKAVVCDCRIIGKQDTLLTAPYFEELDVDPSIFRRQYFENCYIEGNVDFIFGGAVAVFKKCTLFCKKRLKEENNCYVTAACTAKERQFGYVFFDCVIDGDTGKGRVYLGRPWRDYANTVFINTKLSDVVKPELWSNWGNTERYNTARYSQKNCTGIEQKPVEWCNELTDDCLKQYTIENIFDGWCPEA